MLTTSPMGLRTTKEGLNLAIDAQGLEAAMAIKNRNQLMCARTNDARERNPGESMKAACHCTAVRFEISEAPAWVLDCNCTLCRRYGALWSYYHGSDHAKLIFQPTPDLTDTYLWQDRGIAFHRCKVCGCVTHIAAADIGHVFGVNARMMPALDPESVTVIQMNNSHSGWFWTKSNQPVRPSHHPVMSMPGPDDWR